MKVKEFLDLYIKTYDINTSDGIKLRTIYLNDLSLKQEMFIINGDIMRAGTEIYEIKMINDEVKINQLTVNNEGINEI